MKRIILILVVLSLLCLAGCQSAEPTATTVAPTDSVNVTPVDTFDPAQWSKYSDFKLMEMTMKSDQNEFRQLSAVWMTADEWKDYMLDKCEPLRALMLRESALQSLEEHTVALVEQYKDELAGLPAEKFVLLVMTVHPEMKEQLKSFEITFPPRTDQ